MHASRRSGSVQSAQLTDLRSCAGGTHEFLTGRLNHPLHALRRENGSLHTWHTGVLPRRTVVSLGSRAPSDTDGNTHTSGEDSEALQVKRLWLCDQRRPVFFRCAHIQFNCLNEVAWLSLPGFWDLQPS